MGLWYRTGTVATTNGSAVVTGTGTAFIAAGVSAGDAVFLANGTLLGEVLSVDSATQLTLVENATSTGSGLAYKIQQTGGPQMVSAAYQLTQVSLSYQTVKDQAGAGKFGDGTAAAPGIRFLNDLDTGWGLSAANEIGLGAGGAWRAFIGTYGISFETGGALRMTQKAFGYGGGYRALTLGGAAQSAVAIGVDVSTVAGANFDGNGKELFLANGASILTPNAGGSNWDRVITFYNGNVGLGVTPVTRLDLLTSGGRVQFYQAASTTGVRLLGVNAANSAAVPVEISGSDVRFTNASNQVMGMFDTNSNFLAGVTSGSNHIIGKAAGEGSLVLEVTNGSFGNRTAMFYSVSAAGTGNAAAAAVKLSKNSGTLRSMNADGTVNVSGADGAERMKRSPTCPLILKGQVVGLDNSGELTLDWSEARIFGLKSGLINQPSFIGNDIYGQIYVERVGPAPIAPSGVRDEPQAPTEPAAFIEPMPVMLESEDFPTFAARLGIWGAAKASADAAAAAYEAAAAVFPADHADWAEELASYEADLAIFEATDADWQAGLEEERLRWDCVSFYGQAYCNQAIACEAGDYLVAVQDGDGIGVIAVAEQDMTLPQYMRRIGRVLSIHPTLGYPLLDVQRG